MCREEVMETFVLIYQLLMTPLREKAIRDEVMDRRETWVLSKPESFLEDLLWLGNQYDAAKDCPRMWELGRFPGYEEALASIEQSRAFQSYADARHKLIPYRDVYREAWSQAQLPCQAWSHLRDARSEFSWVRTRRQSLKQLREILGDDDFYSGRMPPPAPLRFFQEVK